MLLLFCLKMCNRHKKSGVLHAWELCIYGKIKRVELSLYVDIKLEGLANKYLWQVKKQLPGYVVCQLFLPAETGFCPPPTPHTFKREKSNLVSQGSKAPLLTQTVGIYGWSDLKKNGTQLSQGIPCTQLQHLRHTVNLSALRPPARPPPSSVANTLGKQHTFLMSRPQGEFGKQWLLLPRLNVRDCMS